MLKPFVLHTPDTVNQAVELLWQHEDAKIVAGGTDVFVEMHNGAAYPRLVDIKGLGKLHCVDYDPEAGRGNWSSPLPAERTVPERTDAR